MKNLKFNFLLSFFLLLISASNGQFKLDIFGGAALPGKELSQLNFPKIGAGYRVGLHYSFFSEHKLRLDAGIDFNYIVCGDKKYRFGGDKDYFYNLALTANADARLVLNTKTIKPYIGVGYGALGTSVNEKFYNSKTANTTTSEVITNITTWNNTIAVGFLIELTEDVELDFGITHFNGGKNRFVDFDSVKTDNNYVYITPKTSSIFDLYFLHLGFIFTLHRDYNGSSNFQGGSSIRSSVGSINTGKSHRYRGPQR
ncbi:MAG: outer membrane beta-barrel protein [Flavobacteriales bacterium]